MAATAWRSRSGRPVTAASSAVDEREQHAGAEAQLSADVAALAHVGERADLVAVHEIAAPPEVGPRHPVGRDVVMDLGARLVEDGGRAVRMGDPMREVHVVVVVGMEPADSEHRVATHAHARADQAAYGREPVRQRLVMAAEHPIEIGREPGWPRRPVIRPRRTADREGARARGVHGEQPLEPIRFRYGVVVEEGDDLSAGEQQRGVARRTLPARELACDDDDLDGRVGGCQRPIPAGTGRATHRCGPPR